MICRCTRPEIPRMWTVVPCGSWRRVDGGPVHRPSDARARSMQLLQDRVSPGSPLLNGRQFALCAVTMPSRRRTSGSTMTKEPWRIALSVISVEKRPTSVQRSAADGDEAHVPARPACPPRLDFGGLRAAQLSFDPAHSQLGAHGLVDLEQERQEPLVAVTLLAAGEQERGLPHWPTCTGSLTESPPPAATSG